jgi:hypothetical protein
MKFQAAIASASRSADGGLEGMIVSGHEYSGQLQGSGLRS